MANSSGDVRSASYYGMASDQDLATNEAPVVLITGAAGETGVRIGMTLLASGWRVAAADNDVAALGRWAAVLREQTLGRFHAVQVDLASDASCTNAVLSAVSHFGRVDAVVNHAAIGSAIIRQELSRSGGAAMAQAWDQLFAINLRAAMLVTQAAMPILERQQSGRILVISPRYDAGHLELPLVAAMAALEAMWAVWAREVRAKNIMVNVLARAEPPGSGGEERGRSGGEGLGSSNVGSPARWLLSREANGVTGFFIDAELWRDDLPSSEAAYLAARLLAAPRRLKPNRPPQAKGPGSFDLQSDLPKLRADFFKLCKGDYA